MMKKSSRIARWTGLAASTADALGIRVIAIPRTVNPTKNHRVEGCTLNANQIQIKSFGGGRNLH